MAESTEYGFDQIQSLASHALLQTLLLVLLKNKEIDKSDLSFVFDGAVMGLEVFKKNEDIKGLVEASADFIATTKEQILTVLQNQDSES